MKIKHYIITRFLSVNFTRTTEELLTPEHIQYHMNLLKHNFLKTLENQTCKDFEIVIEVHDELKEEYIKELQSIPSSLKIHVVRRKDASEFINSFDKTQYDYCIVSRLDDDDFVRKDIVADTVSHVCDCENGILCYGYIKGYIGFDWTDKIVDMPDVRYACGHFSCMQSYIYDLRKISDITDVANCNHTNVGNYLEQVCSSHGLTFDKEANFMVGPEHMYVWYRHGDTGTMFHPRYDSEDFKKKQGEVEQQFCKKYGVYKKWFDKEGVCINKADFGWD